MSNDFSPAGTKRTPRKEQMQSVNVPVAEKSNLQIGDPIVQMKTDDDPIGRRIEEERAKRKQRGKVDMTALSLKLSVPEEFKDPRLVYRWANDSSMRHHFLKQKGWDYADNAAIAGDERNSGLGTRIERIANERTTPTVEKTFLMCKPKEFYEEDKAIEQDKIKANESQMKRAESVRNSEGQAASGMYVPEGGMKIEHGR